MLHGFFLKYSWHLLLWSAQSLSLPCIYLYDSPNLFSTLTRAVKSKLALTFEIIPQIAVSLLPCLSELQDAKSMNLTSIAMDFYYPHWYNELPQYIIILVIKKLKFQTNGLTYHLAWTFSYCGSRIWLDSCKVNIICTQWTRNSVWASLKSSNVQ